MEEEMITDGVKEYRLDSWREFFDFSVDVLNKAPANIYRGQSNWDWAVSSSLDRLRKKYPKKKNICGNNPDSFECTPLSEEEQLKAFRNSIRGRRGQSANPLDDDACWALGQHHGLATPLVDWTRSPFIALFFAFNEEHVLMNSNNCVEPEYRAVFALSTSVFGKESGEQVNELRFVSPPGEDNDRLISQSALFVRLPRNEDLETYVRRKFKEETHRPVLIKIRIPNRENDRHDCLVTLNKMNINHMALFPDITGAALHVNSIWEPGHEDSIKDI